MTKRMLIDATHAEETRVVVLDGNRLEDFDVETASRRQLKGNIYLAKVVRVEPSLQAAFVEYGGNRHGFLAFGEIHPDYYQIPVADRQRLLQMQEDEARAAEQAEDEEVAETSTESSRLVPLIHQAELLYADTDPAADETPADTATRGDAEDTSSGAFPDGQNGTGEPDAVSMRALEGSAAITSGDGLGVENDAGADDDSSAVVEEPRVEAATFEADGDGSRVQHVPDGAAPPPETLGGESDPADEPRQARMPSRYLRNYKIQEVIRRRQILLIQVVKEERGTKGAALTTYLSLAGRFCVLMPNSPRGGGISRKITSAADRRRLKEVTAELEIPRGMGLIVRTAGAARPKPEIKRDCEYLLRLWDEIREHTMQSVAPALIYEEASLIKRAIRDVYSRDVDEILVDGEEGWKAARDFMRMLMPTHVKKVQLWRDGGTPLFARQQVEAQLDGMLMPTVQLRSGGYLVINQTEALVAIDVNSGRSTRERGIEETALRTNLEAADEVARQLRLRDLAGLIVIDFIDMESKKHNAAVERRMKDALRDDRARIQLGSISHFGLLEMSRQRLRPSLAETSQSACPHCGGTGHVRSTDSAALHVLRAIEDEGSKRRAAEIMVHVAGPVAMYILNNKRIRLMEIEQRTGLKVCFGADATLLPGQSRIERLRVFSPQDLPPPVSQTQSRMDSLEENPSSTIADEAPIEETGDEDDDEEDAPDGIDAGGAQEGTDGGQRSRRKRRRRRGGRREDPQTGAAGAPMPPDAEQPDVEEMAFSGALPGHAPFQGNERLGGSDHTESQRQDVSHAAVDGHAEMNADASPRARSRGRRGRGRGPRPTEDAAVPLGLPPGMPTPADPFGGVADIFDILEQAAEQGIAASAPQSPPQVATEAPSGGRPSSAANEETTPVLPHSAPDGATSAPSKNAVVPSIDPVVGAAVQPMIIGESNTGTATKRGWWRR